MAFKLGYRPELDGLRAFAVVPVMLGHSAILGRGSDLLGAGMGFPVLMKGGVYGVDMFFVLSGFLITTLLLQEHRASSRIDFRAFYIRRALRLLPAMGLTAIFSAIYVVFFKPPTSAFDLVAVALAALYVANFVLTFAGLRLGMLTPTWSLAVEEQFYTIWPLALSYLLRLKRKKILAIAAGLVVFGALLRAFMHYEGGRLMSWPLYAGSRHILFARADGLMCGAIVAMAASWGWLSEKFPKRFLVAAASASAVTLGMMLLFGPDDDKSLVYSTYVCASVLTGALIAGLVTAPPAWLSAILAWGPLVWIGKISYGLYLYHMPVFSLMPATPPSYLPAAVGPFAVYAFAFALTFAIATASYYLVEKRFLDLRHKLGAPRGAQQQPEFVLSR